MILTISQGILTILRNKETDRQDFIFFVDRLSTVLSEKALEYLPFRPKDVVTPVEVVSHGKEVDVQASSRIFSQFIGSNLTSISAE